MTHVTVILIAPVATQTKNGYPAGQWGDGLGRVFTISTPVRTRDGQIEAGVRMRPLTVSQVALTALGTPLKDLSRRLT